MRWAIKTLLVEDDPDLRRMIQDLLVPHGYDVAAFGDAEAAWEADQVETFPLIILDWLLPGADGLELCRRIRNTRDGEDRVILVMTARDRPEDLMAVLHAGADDYLPKPFDVRSLQVRLSIAKRRVHGNAERRRAIEALLRAKAVEAERRIEHARLEGVTLAAREIAHQLNNDLTLVVGFMELVQRRTDLAIDVQAMIAEAMTGLDSATQHIIKLQQIVRVATKDTPLGPALDLDQSVQPS